MTTAGSGNDLSPWDLLAYPSSELEIGFTW